jgi:hypothetical protein
MAFDLARQMVGAKLRWEFEHARLYVIAEDWPVLNAHAEASVLPVEISQPCGHHLPDRDGRSRRDGAQPDQRAMRHKARRGEYTGGGVPYGFRLADDGVHLEELPSEQAVIRLARRLRESGLSYVKVAAELECQGVRARTGRCPRRRSATCWLRWNSGRASGRGGLILLIALRQQHLELTDGDLAANCLGFNDTFHLLARKQPAFINGLWPKPHVERMRSTPLQGHWYHPAVLEEG